jgi:hypothetical protein
MSQFIRNYFLGFIILLLSACSVRRGHLFSEAYSMQCYCEIYNTIPATGSSWAMKNTHLENQAGEIFPWNNVFNCFQIKSSTAGAQTFYLKKTGSNKLIDSYTFNFQQMPECRPNVTIQTNNKIETEDLLSISDIEIIQPNGLCCYSIKSFSFSCNRSGNYKEYHSDSAQLTEQMKKELFLLKKGDHFYIGQIEAYYPNGEIHIIAPIDYTVI